MNSRTSSLHLVCPKSHGLLFSGLKQGTLRNTVGCCTHFSSNLISPKNRYFASCAIGFSRIDPNTCGFPACLGRYRMSRHHAAFLFQETKDRSNGFCFHLAGNSRSCLHATPGHLTLRQIVAGCDRNLDLTNKSRGAYSIRGSPASCHSYAASWDLQHTYRR